MSSHLCRDQCLIHNIQETRRNVCWSQPPSNFTLIENGIFSSLLPNQRRAPVGALGPHHNTNGHRGVLSHPTSWTVTHDMLSLSRLEVTGYHLHDQQAFFKCYNKNLWPPIMLLIASMKLNFDSISLNLSFPAWKDLKCQTGWMMLCMLKNPNDPDCRGF